MKQLSLLEIMKIQKKILDNIKKRNEMYKNSLGEKIKDQSYEMASKKFRLQNMQAEKPYIQLGYSLKDKQAIYKQELANYNIGKPKE